MPLSERLRIQAGRPFSHTLAARLLVAVILLIIALYIGCRTVDYNHRQQGLNNNKDNQGLRYANVGTSDIYGR